MLSSEEIKKFKKTSLVDIQPEKLKDITSVKLDISQPLEERMESLFSQLENPYIFLSGNTPVKISFSDNDSMSLDEILARHLLNEQNK